MRFFKNISGQALVESIWVMPLFVLLLSSFLFLSYTGIVYVWGEYINYETALCYSMDHKKTTCESYFYKSLNPILFAGDIKKIQLSKNGYNFRGISTILIGGIYELNFEAKINRKEF